MIVYAQKYDSKTENNKILLFSQMSKMQQDMWQKQE